MTGRLAVPSEHLHQSFGSAQLQGSSKTGEQDEIVKEPSQRAYSSDIQASLDAARHQTRSVEESAARLKDGLDRFRSLLHQYQKTRNDWEAISQKTQHATEGWIPNIRQDIDNSHQMAEEVASRLDPLEDRLKSQLEEYHRGIQQAAHVQNQLEWHAASWTNKLRKILLGEVKGKRLKFLRIVAPFFLAAAILLVVGMAGQLTLAWGLLYYRNLGRGPGRDPKSYRPTGKL